MSDRSTPPLGSLYQELILDHYRHPRNRGELEEPDREAHVRNPTCGDEIRLQLRLGEDGRIADVRFTGEGCSISQAAASMMTQLMKGRTPDEAAGIGERFTRMLHADEEAARDRELGDLRALAGVAKFPVRVKCALLGFDAMKAALGDDGRG